MAKLSANGRKELIRLEKEVPVEETANISYDRRTIALMSDGKVLEKRDVVFKPTSWETKPQKHTWGWTVKGKAKEGMTPERFAEIFGKQGYTVR